MSSVAIAGTVWAASGESVAGSAPAVATAPAATTGALSLDPLVLAVIAAMAVVTALTKVGGLWVLGRVEVSERTEAALSVLPGAIVIAILGPELASGGPAEWAGAGVVVAVMWRTENILFALVAGLAAVVALRSLL